MGNTRENFIRDGSQLFRQFGDRDVFPEYFHFITDGGIRVGDVDHAGIHTDIPDDGYPFSFHEDVSDTIAQVAVQTVGVSHGNDRDTGGTGGKAFTTVPDGLSFRYFPDRGDVCLETAHGLEGGIGGTDPV